MRSLTKSFIIVTAILIFQLDALGGSLIWNNGLFNADDPSWVLLLEGDLEGLKNNNSKKTYLHFAAEKNKPEIAKALIEAGAIIDAKDNVDYTPLHSAAIRGNYEAAKALIEKGADLEALAGINATILPQFSKQKNTPLHYAAKGGYAKIVKALLEKGANPNAKTSRGNTPLHFAVKKWKTDTVKLLIKFKADLDTQDHKYGNTALHYCVINRTYDNAVEIIKHDANIGLKNKEGYTPLQLALKTADKIPWRKKIAEALQAAEQQAK